MPTPELLALSSRLSIGAAQVFRNLTVLPLIDATAPPTGWLTLDQAIGRGVAEISEISEHGSVPQLRLRNRAGENAVPARRRGTGRRQAEPHPQSQHPGAGRVGTGHPRVVRRAGPVVVAVAPVPGHRAGDLFEAATEQQRGGVPQPRPRRLEPRRPGPGVGRHRDEVGAHVRPFRYLGGERPLRALRARPRRVRRQRRGAAGPGGRGLRRQWPVRRSRSAGRARPRARPAAQAGPQLRPRCPRGQRRRRRAGPERRATRRRPGPRLRFGPRWRGPAGSRPAAPGLSARAKTFACAAPAWSAPR